MPVEIREIVIKTEVISGGKKKSAALTDKELKSIKKQLFEEVKRMMSDSIRRNNYKR